MKTFAGFLRWVGFLTAMSGIVFFAFWIFPIVFYAVSWGVASFGAGSVGITFVVIGFIIFFLGQWVSPYVSKQP